MPVAIAIGFPDALSLSPDSQTTDYRYRAGTIAIVTGAGSSGLAKFWAQNHSQLTTALGTAGRGAGARRPCRPWGLSAFIAGAGGSLAVAARLVAIFLNCSFCT